jgi:5-methylcytosine-specific restriction endonuclease McrA
MERKRTKGQEAYLERLRDPRWQRRRLDIFQRDAFTCQKCGDEKSTLHVHHWRYLFGRDPWEYSDEDLVTLCQSCHEQETNFHREVLKKLQEVLEIRGWFYNEISSLADALFSARCTQDAVNMLLARYNDPVYGQAMFEAAFPNEIAKGQPTCEGQS